MEVFWEVSLEVFLGTFLGGGFLGGFFWDVFFWGVFNGEFLSVFCLFVFDGFT